MAGILRELMLLQEREGWLPEAELRAIAERLGVPLHRIESVSTFYTHFRRTPPDATRVAVCRDVACAMAGGAESAAALGDRLRSAGAVVEEVSCLGRCDAAPAACVGQRTVSLSDEASVFDALGDSSLRERPRRSWSEPLDAETRSPAATLGELLGRDAPALIAELEASGLRGMGGAGFPTARKWSLVAAAPAGERHVVCNADESEPGTFKDREILNDLPHLVIEGMVLAGHCIGASRGTVFIRHEYEAERVRLEAAIAAARNEGRLGTNVAGSGRDFDIEVFVSPGGYILGEETALLECMEDRRGEPRNKPPFPGQRGLHGMPTLINNVETFAHAACILGDGAEWWRGLGVRGRAGHKFLAVSGDVARPGVELVPVGTTLGELLERRGGMKEGADLAAIAPGGASSLFLPADSLGVEIDFDSLAETGSMLGSGAVIFVAKGRSLLDVGLDVARFFRNESCGKCVPCRVGTEKAVALVEAQTGSPGADLEAQLRELHGTLERTSICGLGQVALSPLLSILERFPAERDRRGDG